MKEIDLGHRYNEHDDVYGTKFKGKSNDTSRRKGYGHTLQTTFAILCVKLGPHFKVLSHSGVKIPESIRGTTVIRKHAKDIQIDVADVHSTILTVRSAQCVKNLSWIWSDGSPWDLCGVRDEILELLDTLDKFCIRRFKQKEQMQCIRQNSTKKDKFSKNFKIFDIQMSTLINQQFTKHSIFPL